MTVTRPTITAGDGDHRHGTPNGYENLNCRCERCRVAERSYQKRMAEVYPHGAEARYSLGACRCQECREDQTQRRRRRRLPARPPRGTSP